MGRALYRKYRSKKLSEIVGQEQVVAALSNALKSNKIGHAYLFTGPRGTGKTSIARILAHEINKIPYTDDAEHLDIIEIDAASNRRIDEIRSLRDKVHNAPSIAKYKIYIIDEVHMLTREAFNALLKTLEEPPKHVIFILATTEVHKLPETIISRTQKYTFKPATPTEVINHLKTIAKQEKINISDQALELIADHGGGSLRDSISILDQARHLSDKVELNDIQRLLGLAPEPVIQGVINNLATGDIHKLTDQLIELKEQGFQASQISQHLIKSLRNSLIAQKNLLSRSITTRLMTKLIDVPASHDPFTLLEIILLDTAFSQNAVEVNKEPTIEKNNPTPSNTQVKPQTSGSEPKGNKKPTTETKQATSEQAVKEESETSETSPGEDVEASKDDGTEKLVSFDEDGWQSILAAIKKKHNTLYGIARMAVPFFDDGKLTLSFDFPFHQKKFNDAKNKKIISDIVKTETGQKVEVTSIVKTTGKEKTAQQTKTLANTEDAIKNISNIFGGAEVLE